MTVTLQAMQCDRQGVRVNAECELVALVPKQMIAKAHAKCSWRSVEV